MVNLTSKHYHQLFTIADNIEKDVRNISAESALVSLMRICRDYADKTYFPHVDRERTLIERLTKWRIRYYDQI